MMTAKTLAAAYSGASDTALSGKSFCNELSDTSAKATFYFTEVGQEVLYTYTGDGSGGWSVDSSTSATSSLLGYECYQEETFTDCVGNKGVYYCPINAAADEYQNCSTNTFLVCSDPYQHPYKALSGHVAGGGVSSLASTCSLIIAPDVPAGLQPYAQVELELNTSGHSAPLDLTVMEGDDYSGAVLKEAYIDIVNGTYKLNYTSSTNLTFRINSIVDNVLGDAPIGAALAFTGAYQTVINVSSSDMALASGSCSVDVCLDSAQKLGPLVYDAELASSDLTTYMVEYSGADSIWLDFTALSLGAGETLTLYDGDSNYNNAEPMVTLDSNWFFDVDSGNAATFEDDSYILIEDVGFPSTVAFWYKGAATNASIFSASGKLEVEVVSGALKATVDGNGYYARMAMDTNEWVHVAVLIDEGLVEFVVNGRRYDSCGNAGLSAKCNDVVEQSLGVTNDDGYYKVGGSGAFSLDHLMFFDEKIDMAEVQGLALNGSFDCDFGDERLTGCYNFDQTFTGENAEEVLDGSFEQNHAVAYFGVATGTGVGDAGGPSRMASTTFATTSDTLYLTLTPNSTLVTTASFTAGYRAVTDCSCDSGTCVRGVCQCDAGYGGETCDTWILSSACSTDIGALHGDEFRSVFGWLNLTVVDAVYRRWESALYPSPAQPLALPAMNCTWRLSKNAGYTRVDIGNLEGCWAGEASELIVYDGLNHPGEDPHSKLAHLSSFASLDRTLYTGSSGEMQVTLTTSGGVWTCSNSTGDYNKIQLEYGQPTVYFVAPNTDFPVEGTRDGSAESPYSSINTALKAASDNDVIILYPGRYEDTSTTNNIGLTIDFPVTIRGLSEPEYTVIDANLAGRHFDIDVPYGKVTIENIQFLDGKTSSDGASLNIDNSIVELNNCAFKTNRGTSGGTLNAAGSSLILSEVTFESNTLSSAMYMYSTTVTASNTTFTMNTNSRADEGLITLFDSKALFSGTNLVSNTNTGGGSAGFYVNGEDSTEAVSLTVTDTDFYGNSADYYTCFLITGANASVDLSSTTFMQNQGSGLITVQSSASITVDGIYAENNYADDASACNGIFYGSELNMFTLTNSEFTSSSIPAVYIKSSISTPVISSTSFSHHNISTQCECNLGFVDGSSCPEITDVTYERNKVESGGNILLRSCGTAVIDQSSFSKNSAYDGGALYVEDAAVTVEDSEFKQNYAEDYGGAIMVYGTDANQEVVFEQVVFTENECGGYGGAVLLSSVENAIGRNTEFTNCTGGGGGSLSLVGATASFEDLHIVSSTGTSYGGGVSAISMSTLTLDGFTIKESSSPLGGAISVRSQSNLYLKDGTMDHNRADEGGGLAIQEDSDFTIRRTTISNNYATLNGGALFFVKVTPSGTALDQVNMVNNTAVELGGAIYAALCDNLILTNVTANNSVGLVSGANIASLASNWEISDSQMFEAYSEQGSLYLLHSEFISTGNNFSDGTVNSNGGLLYAFASQLYVNDTSFRNGEAGDSGGGLFLFDSESIFYRTTFARNTAGSNGGGLYVTGTEFVYFHHCTFAWNYANVGAGVYYYSNDDLIVHGSLYDHNIVYQQGAGMYVSTVDHVTITNSEFVSNWVEYDSYESSYGGGALYFNYIDDTSDSTDNDLNICFNDFTDNGGSYTDGGAIWVGYSYAYLKSNSFTRNTAYNGAGVYLGPEPVESTANSVTVARRAWEAAGGRYEAGGEGYSPDGRLRRFLRAHDRRLAEATVSSTITLTGSTFASGTATAGGGAFYYEENEPAGAANTTYSNNSAAFGSDLVSMPSYIDATKVSNLEVSGQVITTTYVNLRDVYGQVYGLESDGTVFATASTDGSAVGGTSSTTFDEGVATFDKLTATLNPDTVMNVSFSAAGTVDGTASIEVIFRPCLTGEIVENGECVECEYGTFSLDTSDWTCYNCPSGAVCNGGKDIRAQNGYWRMNTTVYNRAGTCNEEDGEPTYESCAFFSCYTDGACLGDILLSNLSRANVPDGTFRFTESNILTKLDNNCGINNGNYTNCKISVEGNIFYVMDAYEVGSNNIDLKVIGNMTAIAHDENYQVYLMLEEECGTGYKGNVCAKCRPGYGATGFALCEKCPNSLLVSYIFVGMGCLAVVFIGAVMIKMNMNKDNSENERLSIMLKIFTNYMQLVSLFGGLEISWPDAIVTLFEGQETVSRVGDKLIIIDCVLNDAQSQAGASAEDDDSSTFFQKLAFYMSAPILAVVFSFIFWTYQYFKKVRKFSKKKNWDIDSEALAPFTEDGLITKDEIPELLVAVGENSQPMRVTDIINFMGLEAHPARTEDFKDAFLNCYRWLMKENAILSIVVLLFLLYPTVTTYNFQVFTCVELGTGQWFLQNDLDTECYTPLHNLWLFVCGVPFLMLYTVGIPYSAYLVLHHYRYDLDDKHVKLKYGFLYDGFERKYYFWEMWVMLRKVAVISSTVFIPQFFGDVTEVLAGLCICLTSLLFHLNCQPYDDDQLDVLEALSLYTTVLTMICGLFFYSGELMSWGQSLMVVLIIFFNVAFVVYFCYAAYTDFKQKLFANYQTAVETAQMVKSKLSGKKISKEEKEMISQATEKFVEFEGLMNDRMKIKDQMLKATVEMEELKRAFRVKRGEYEDMEHEVHLNEAEVIELMQDDSAVTQYMLHGGEAGPGKITSEELYAYYPDLRKEEAEEFDTTLAADDEHSSTVGTEKRQEGGKAVQDMIMSFFQAQKSQQELELELKAKNKKKGGILPTMKKKSKPKSDPVVVEDVQLESAAPADTFVEEEKEQLDEEKANAPTGGGL
uniref:Uncharacterized protein n=1 Tax=Heterosigma akashiwo TaxID=2829 RepID=A0A7S3Y6H3_HETAK